MSDLISRSALKKKSTKMYGFGNNKYISERAVDEAPAVDAVPLVRCKDCKWLWKKNMLCIHPKHCDGMVAVCECDKDDFCRHGERKEE